MSNISVVFEVGSVGKKGDYIETSIYPAKTRKNRKSSNKKSWKKVKAIRQERDIANQGRDVYDLSIDRIYIKVTKKYRKSRNCKILVRGLYFKVNVQEEIEIIENIDLRTLKALRLI